MCLLICEIFTNQTHRSRQENNGFQRGRGERNKMMSVKGYKVI